MAKALKDRYSGKFPVLLANYIHQEYPSFDEATFVSKVFSESWDGKSLKERMRHISICMNKLLDLDYPETIRLLKKVAPKVEDALAGMVFPDYVEVYGLDSWDISMSALEFFTKYSSSEFAVRPFIKKDPKKMMKQMEDWARHENKHVRRLASEGCRPRLPWADDIEEFKNNPSPILPILEHLKNDESKYVRRSVSNNLNDISKDHPEVVLDIANKWYGENDYIDWIIKRGLRTLTKERNQEAISLLGYNNVNYTKVVYLKLNKESLKKKKKLYFSFEVHTEKASKLMLEYSLDFMRPNGRVFKKIFKIKDGEFKKGITLFKKSHSFKDLSTRKHYPGEHRIAILINGVEKAVNNFIL